MTCVTSSGSRYLIAGSSSPFEQIYSTKFRAWTQEKTSVVIRLRSEGPNGQLLALSGAPRRRGVSGTRRATASSQRQTASGEATFDDQEEAT
jgi:hypothetical protein